MGVLLQLESLEQQRQTVLQNTPKLHPDTREEYKRQARELQRYPSGETLRTNLAGFAERLAQLQSGAIDGQQLQAPASLLDALELGRRQWVLLLERDDATPALLAKGTALAERETLCKLLRDPAIPPAISENLFGLSIYALTMENLHARAEAQISLAEKRYADFGPNAPSADVLYRIQDTLKALRSTVTRELAALEPPLAEAFWAAYEHAAAVLANRKAPAEAIPALRAFLRYGMIGGTPWFLPADLARQLLANAGKYQTELETGPSALHVLHADEYIDFAARGLITPSVDEEMALKEQRSTRWKKDQAWRRQIASTGRIGTLEATLADLEGKRTALQSEIVQLDADLAALKPTDKNSLANKTHWRAKLQEDRVSLARRSQYIDILAGRILPRERERLVAAQTRLNEAGGPPTPTELATSEARQIHRLARLCARLKDPFLPFILRQAKFDTPAINDRHTMRQAFAQIERSDTTLFKDILINSKNTAHRTLVRYSPYVLILPSQGIMGFSLNPRDITEVGRLIFPGYCPRPGLLPAILTAVCSDFRWDTSKESAGMDLLTSDTLVAAYCTVRWNMRKHPTEVRERAQIYQKENDRRNFRRHYQLFLDSAHDAGKRLYFTCPDIYEAFCKYIGLPGGQTKMHH